MKEISQLNVPSKEWFDIAFKGYDIPEDIRRLSEILCRAYGIYGTADPMYIANVIAKELERGDGQGNFYEDKRL